MSTKKSVSLKLVGKEAEQLQAICAKTPFSGKGLAEVIINTFAPKILSGEMVIHNGKVVAVRELAAAQAAAA